MPRSQTPPVPTTNAPTVTQAALTTMVTKTPAHETRAGWKRPRGAGQTSAAPDFENSPPNLRDASVNVMGAPPYPHSFTMDGVPLL